MAYYDAFLSLHNDNYSQGFRDEDQEILNEDFENSPTFHNDILQEVQFGSLEFRKIKARIVKIMDSKVGDRINDDYRKIIFPDNNFKPELGSRYKFDNNIWIVYSTDNIKSLRSSCYIRRCNNTINLQDKYGNVHQEPCIIDVKPTKSGVQEQEYMGVPIARQVVEFQVNKWTEHLFVNSRIMFNRQVYKIGSIMELNRTETFNSDSIKFVKCYVDNDLKNEYDNEELQVADYKIYNYTINCNDEINLLNNKEGNINANVYLDEQLVEEHLVWESLNSNIVEVNKRTGMYKTKSLGNTIIRVTMLNKPDTFKEIKINVTDQEAEIYKNIITPKEEYIPLNTTQKYQVYELVNGDRTNTSFSILASGMSEKYYKLEVSNNEFTIKNLKQNGDELLVIECTNNRNGTKEKLLIELGGLF